MTLRATTSVATSVTEISAPGTIALEGSVTVPLIVDLSDWAINVPPASRNAVRPDTNKKRTRLSENIGPPFLEVSLKTQGIISNLFPFRSYVKREAGSVVGHWQNLRTHR